ncbi:MAG: BBP7 family outer membrane beta-barrel protein [Gemmataceae bacterium]
MMHSRKFGLMAGLLASAGSVWAQAPVSNVNAPRVMPPAAMNSAPAYSAVANGAITGNVPQANALPGTIPGQAANAPLITNGVSYPTVNTLSNDNIIPSETFTNTGPKYYGSADYLLWHIRDTYYPNVTLQAYNRLVTVNYYDLYYQQQATGNVIFRPDISDDFRQVRLLPFSVQSNVDFAGGPKSNIGSQNGARFRLGFWDDSDETWGMESSFFFISRGGEEVSGSPVTQSQFALDTGFTQQAFLIVIPAGTISGGTTLPSIQPFPSGNNSIVLPYSSITGIAASVSTEMLGADVNGRWTSVRFGSCTFGGLAGFRWIGFRDELSASSYTQMQQIPGLSLNYPPINGQPSVTFGEFGNLFLATYDRIRIWNHFFGGQVGVDMNAQFGGLFLDSRIKLGVGTMVQCANVTSTTVQVGFQGFTSAGGLLSSPSDQGNHSRCRFAFVPEYNGRIGYDFTNWLRGYVGYDALYMTGVARASNSSKISTINSTIQVGSNTQQVTVAQPTFRFSDSDLWVQGISFGLEVTY